MPYLTGQRWKLTASLPESGAHRICKRLDGSGGWNGTIPDLHLAELAENL